MSSMMQKRKGGFDLNNQKVPGTLDSQTVPAKTAIISCQIWRYYIATLGFVSLAMINVQRMGMAVSVVNMSNTTSASSIEQRNSSLVSCPVTSNTTLDLPRPQTGGEFDWSPQLQGFILGAAFLGFSFGLFIGGRLANRFGAKMVIFWGNSVASAGMLLCPTFSFWHAYSLIALQFIRGIGQGFVLPSAYMIMANWTPKRERGFISSFIMTGFYVGSMSGGLISGALCENPHLGWRSVYYILGGVGLLFSLLFILTFYETPKDHPKISEAELKYITEDQAGDAKQDERLPTPWLKMLTSIPTYALLFGILGYYWKIYYFLSVHPAYLSTILHFSIMKSGFLASLPFLLKILGSLIVSASTDWLYRRKYIGVDKLRRGCTFIGCLGFALSMLGLYLAKCSELLNNVFSSTALLSAGAVTAGAAISGVDMTPNFAGTLMGVVSSVASTCGLIIPVVVGYLTKDQTLEGWQNVFLLNMVVVMTCGIVFVVFGSAKVQPWNSPAEDCEKVTSNNKKPSSDENAKENKF